VAWEKADCEGARSSSSCFLYTSAVVFQQGGFKIQLGPALQTDSDAGCFQSLALIFT